MKFQDREGNLAYPYLTSWGFTTRSIGAIIMVHGDQKGLVMPPRVAPIQVVIIPIFSKHIEKEVLLAMVKTLGKQLEAQFRVYIDDRDYETPGAKFYEWELKGVPLRVEIGPRDLEKEQVVVTQRLEGQKESVPLDELLGYVQESLDTLHHDLFKKAELFLTKHWHKREFLQDFSQQLETEGGFYQTGWCENHACEQKLKEYKATIRCILPTKEFKYCFVCKKNARCDILVARAY